MSLSRLFYFEDGSHNPLNHWFVVDEAFADFNVAEFGVEATLIEP